MLKNLRAAILKATNRIRAEYRAHVQFLRKSETTEAAIYRATLVTLLIAAAIYTLDAAGIIRVIINATGTTTTALIQ